MNGILIGNGASRAVWHRFAYGSLLEKAKSNESRRTAHKSSGDKF